MKHEKQHIMKRGWHVTTIQCDYSSGSQWAEGLWMYDQEGSLQAVREGHPGQVSKDQHEAKTIVHNVHSGQNGLLLGDEAQVTS